MSDNFGGEPMVEIFVYETLQLIEQLEQSVLDSEKSDGFESSIDEIFRIMHSIKGSASMMLYNNIASVAHSLEDLFDYIRKEHLKNIDTAKITDLVLNGLDFIKNEIQSIQSGGSPNGNEDYIVKNIKDYLSSLKDSNISLSTDFGNEKISENQKFYISAAKSDKKSVKGNKYTVMVYFEDDCEMENIRAFTVAHNLKELVEEVETYPEQLMENRDSIEIIRNQGFKIDFHSDKKLEELKKFFDECAFVKEAQINQIENTKESDKRQELILESLDMKTQYTQQKDAETENNASNTKQNMISVNISKLDVLMDMVGELVISEAMVTQNPELAGLNLDNFHKAARQLKKITNEIQDIVMSIRMVPLAITFQKMNRVVRDMSKKLNKDVQLEIIGEETEVDKSIIENISDPLMHLIRNSMDHGIETPEERISKGKSEKGKITLEARNSGGDVWILIKDDGRGLNKEKILSKAKENGLLNKPVEEMTDKEIYSLIFLPGFSTKEQVSEYSGRGVGMDVVVKNIEKVRGAVTVDSTPDQGSVITIKIPLTLAIIDGMNIKVGNSRYTIPITSIKESFRINDEEVIIDPDGNEMIMVRGECYPVFKLHELYNVKDAAKSFGDGIVIMVEAEEKVTCMFADALIGEQQVVVKALPKYIRQVRGVAGCTLLGDGSISLILDISNLVNI